MGKMVQKSLLMSVPTVCQKHRGSQCERGKGEESKAEKGRLPDHVGFCHIQALDFALEEGPRQFKAE